MRFYKVFSCLFFVFAFLSTVLMAHRAEAVLGGSADSVESDRKFFSAKNKNTTSHPGYTVEQLDLSGTAIREYISPSGIVFGIAWNGIIHPNLNQLLGSYAEQYQDVLKKTPRIRGRRRIQIKASQVIVEKWGHMRDLQGRAYVPDLIPPRVTADEIK